MSVKVALLVILQDVRSNISGSGGICFNMIVTRDRLRREGRIRLPVAACSSRLLQEMQQIWETWPKYSGSLSYPVPAPESSIVMCGVGETKFELAERLFHTNSQGYWDGEYGMLRMELLDYLISELKDRIIVDGMLLTILKSIRDDGPNLPSRGICTNVEVKLPEDYRWMRPDVTKRMEQLWKTWPKYSGNAKYPVPATNRHRELFEALGGSLYQDINQFAFVRSVGEMWEGEHGDLRKALLNHMIFELEDAQ